MLKSVALVLLILLGAVALLALAGTQLPVKHEVSRTAEFTQSPQQVWDLITGPPTWRPDVQRYEVLSSEAGHQKWREYGTHSQKIAYEVVEAYPPHRLITRIADPQLPFGGTWTYEIAPTGNGSRLTITENGEIYNPIFRFVSKYLQGYSATIDNYLAAMHAKLGAS
jgi:uncharacterized protein YndB with AHSA1/START domain